MEDTADMWDWNTFIENQNGAFAEQVNIASEAETMIPMDQLQIYSMGEEIYETTYAKDAEGAAVESNDVAIKVDSIQVTEEGYQAYDYEMQSGEDADYVEWNSGLSMDGGMQYFDSQNEIGKNYISSLKAGESAQVHVAWIVNEEDLNRMYLELSGYGVNLTGENRDQAVLVDVRQ